MPKLSQPLVLINGHRQTELSVFDRGLHYGDGFFTTAKIAQGQLLNWPLHWQRLQTSCARLGFPPLDQAQVLTEIQQLFACLTDQQQQDSWVLKLMVTRGQGGRGYAPPAKPQIQRIAVLSAMPDLSEAPIRSEISPVLLEVAPSTAGIKHLNRLSNVLARQALSEGISEAVMLNALGDVVCGTQSNLFLVKQGKLLSSPLNLSGVAGTAQALLKNLAPKLKLKLGLEWQQQPLSLADLLEAEALFFSNAIRGIQSVRLLDLTNIKILTEQFADKRLAASAQSLLSQSADLSSISYGCDHASELQGLLRLQEQTDAFALIATNN